MRYNDLRKLYYIDIVCIWWAILIQEVSDMSDRLSLFSKSFHVCNMYERDFMNEILLCKSEKRKPFRYVYVFAPSET